MNNPALSVVMSVYNGERFLRESIESILNQTFADFEFIMIDDGSTDDTTRILQAFADRDSRVRIYRHNNKGLTYSLNIGCNLARAEIIARMDADDIAIRHRFQWQFLYMQTHPDCDLLGGAYDLIDSQGKRLCSAQLPTEDSEIRQALLDSTAFLHPAVMMRKSALQRVGGYREVKYAEDYDLWLRMSEKGRVANLPQILLQYRVHPNQVSVSKCGEQAMWTSAAQMAASFRRAGKQDPLESVVDVTPMFLTELGVTEEAQQAALARAYLRYIRNMFRTGEYALAQQAVRALHSNQCVKAENWVLADSHLWAAKLHFKEKQFLTSLHSLCNAIVSRPMLLGRPLKALGRGSSKLIQGIFKSREYAPTLSPIVQTSPTSQSPR